MGRWGDGEMGGERQTARQGSNSAFLANRGWRFARTQRLLLLMLMLLMLLTRCSDDFPVSPATICDWRAL